MLRVPIILVKNTPHNTPFIGTAPDDQLYIDAKGEIRCIVGHRFMEGEAELEIKFLNPSELFLYIPAVMKQMAGEKEKEVEELIDYFRMQIFEHIEAYENLLQQNITNETLEGKVNAGRKIVEESLVEAEKELGLTKQQAFFMLEISERIMQEHYRGGFTTEESQEMFSKEVLETFEAMVEAKGTSRRERDDAKAIISFLKTNSSVLQNM